MYNIFRLYQELCIIILCMEYLCGILNYKYYSGSMLKCVSHNTPDKLPFIALRLFIVHVRSIPSIIQPITNTLYSTQLVNIFKRFNWQSHPTTVRCLYKAINGVLRLMTSLQSVKLPFHLNLLEKANALEQNNTCHHRCQVNTYLVMKAIYCSIIIYFRIFIFSQIKRPEYPCVTTRETGRGTSQLERPEEERTNARARRRGVPNMRISEIHWNILCAMKKS